MSLPLSAQANYQAALLTGFLTVAGACSPTQKTAENERSDAGAVSTCLVHEPPQLEDVSNAITGLAERKVDPQTFLREDLDRFSSLESCSKVELNKYSKFQVGLAKRVASLSNAELESQLIRLYDQAFVFNAQSGEMVLGLKPAQVKAKHQLDLWIAALDHQAYEDETFLNRIWDAGAIRAIAMLGSSSIMPSDRGAFEQLRRAVEQEVPLAPVLKDINQRSYRRQFDWLKAYDGSKPYFETDFLKSIINLEAAIRAYFGDEKYVEFWSEASFPRETVKSILKEQSLLPGYEELRTQSTEQLLDYTHEISMAVGYPLRPQTAQRIARDLLLVGPIFHERGIDIQKPLIDRAIRDMVAMGIPKDDVKLMVEVEQGMIKYTADRLDDYRNRFVFLRRYREMYRSVLMRPLETIFSRTQLIRYGFWGSFVMNRSQSGIPVHLKDLDQIRTEVKATAIPKSAFAQDGFTFESRDLKEAFWARPADFGLCGGGGPLKPTAALQYEGKTAGDFICSNIDQMAFLPPTLHPDHAVAAAFGVFGIATVNNAGFVPGNDWTPGVLTGVLIHEAGHINWFRSNFDRHSERLAMAGPNERSAYSLGHAYLAPHFSKAEVAAEEPHLGDFLLQARETTQLANQRLGLPLTDMNPDSWNSQWNKQHLIELAFQPGHLRMERQIEALLVERGKPLPSQDELQMSGQRSLEKAIQLFITDRREQAVARQVLKKLVDGEKTEFLLLRSHPFTRAYNQARASVGLPPLFIIDMNQKKWLEAQAELARRLHITVALQP